MSNQTLMWTNKAKSGLPANLVCCSVEVKSGVVEMHMSMSSGL